MLNTYLNDNLNTPYPFFEGQLPFPMSCITGLGICLHGEPNNYPLYALDVSIGKDFVFMAIGRDSATNVAGELFGIIWAKTDGTYAYFQSVWEYGSELTFWYPYIHYTAAPNATIIDPYNPPPDNEHLENPVYIQPEEAQMIRVYFSRHTETNMEMSHVGGTGYMTLGSIPSDAVGTYKGKFYLDPSCIRWMPTTVFGYHTSITEFAQSTLLDQRFDLSASGILSMDITGNTVTLTAPEADSYTLTEFPDATEPGVKTINGFSVVNGIHKLVIQSGRSDVSLSILQADPIAAKEKDRVAELAPVICIEGSTDFPNCYSPDEAHEQEEPWNANA